MPSLLLQIGFYLCQSLQGEEAKVEGEDTEHEQRQQHINQRQANPEYEIQHQNPSDAAMERHCVEEGWAIRRESL